MALGALERLLRGCRHAVLDLSFSARQEFYERHEYPRHAIPTLCVATCDQRPCSLLRPTIEYIALRYGEWSDGCVCQADAILAACPYVLIDDMDHFGPAWPSFPATDQYDPTRLWLVSTSSPSPRSKPPPSAATDLSSREVRAPRLPLRQHPFCAGHNACHTRDPPEDA